MIKISSKDELNEYMWNDDTPYDVDESFLITDIDYKYPIWLESLGFTSLGHAYKVRNKDEMIELKKIFLEIE